MVLEIFQGAFGIILTTLFCTCVIYSLFEKRSLTNMMELLSLLLIFIIHAVVGFLTALSTLQKLQKKRNQIGGAFDNQNFIPLSDMNINHQIEQQQPRTPLFFDV